VVPLAGELEMNAAMHDPLAVHALADAEVAEEVDGSLLEHAGANPVLDVGTAAILEDHALDAGELEQARERQARRAGADDPDLGPQPASSSRTR
jgi:hypothetical protein